MGSQVITRRGWKRLGMGAAIIAAAVLLALLPVPRWTLQLVEAMRGAGALGVVGFSLAYLAAALLMLPGAILTLAAGFAYGPIWGTLLVSPVSVAAAALAFLASRSVARPAIERRILGSPRFAAIDAAVADGGFRMVLLLRLSPILPYNLLNYALGLTRVGLTRYVAASFLGMLPGTFLYVYLGSLATSAAELASGRRGPGAGGQLLFWGGLAATVLAAWLVGRAARRALDQAMAKPGARQAGAPDIDAAA